MMMVSASASQLQPLRFNLRVEIIYRKNHQPSKVISVEYRIMSQLPVEWISLLCLCGFLNWCCFWCLWLLTFKKYNIFNIYYFFVFFLFISATVVSASECEIKIFIINSIPTPVLVILSSFYHHHITTLIFSSVEFIKYILY